MNTPDRTSGYFDSFTPNARRVLLLSRDEAVSLHHPEIGDEHMLLAIARYTVTAPAIDVVLGVKADYLRRKILTNGSASLVNSNDLSLSDNAKRSISLAVGSAKDLGDSVLAVHHLALGLVGLQTGLAHDLLSKRARQTGLDLLDIKVTLIDLIKTLES